MFSSTPRPGYQAECCEINELKRDNVISMSTQNPSSYYCAKKLDYNGPNNTRSGLFMNEVKYYLAMNE